MNANEHSKVWKRASGQLLKKSATAHTTSMKESYLAVAALADEVAKGYQTIHLDGITAATFKEDQLDEEERRRIHGKESAKDQDKIDRLNAIDRNHNLSSEKR